MEVEEGYLANLPLQGTDKLPTTQPAMKRSAPRQTRVRLRTHEHHLIVVYSLSGGTGKTTIATNLAAALRREEESVLLVDCALQSGDVGVFLNLQAHFTLYDLLQDVERYLPEIENRNPEFLGRPLLRYGRQLDVLLAPRYPHEAESINIDLLVDSIDRLRDSFDFVVVVTASSRDALNVALLELADHVLLVTNPTLPSVKNTHLAIELLDSLGKDTNSVHLVYNQVDVDLEHRHVAIPISRIESHLQRHTLGIIPNNSERALLAINHGVVLVSQNRDSSPAKELVELADRLYQICKGTGQVDQSD